MQVTSKANVLVNEGVLSFLVVNPQLRQPKSSITSILEGVAVDIFLVTRINNSLESCRNLVAFAFALHIQEACYFGVSAGDLVGSEQVPTRRLHIGAWDKVKYLQCPQNKDGASPGQPKNGF